MPVHPSQAQAAQPLAAARVAPLQAGMSAPAGLSLRFLVATGTVTGLRYLVEWQGRRLLVDCGLIQGLTQLRLRNWAPFAVPAASIDAVVLPHAHIDHSGYLPRLVSEGIRGAIHATPGTAKLVSIPADALRQAIEERFGGPASVPDYLDTLTL